MRRERDRLPDSRDADDLETQDENGPNELASLLAAADRILDSVEPVDAERFLRQNQQRGGE